jgi:hypothetical protein
MTDTDSLGQREMRSLARRLQPYADERERKAGQHAAAVPSSRKKIGRVASISA